MKGAVRLPVRDGGVIPALLPSAVLLSLLVASSPALAQEARPPLIRPKDGLVVGSAVLIFSVPEISGWHSGLPSCAPCDSRDLPFFDRWAIHQPNAVGARASDVTRAAIALVGWFDLAGEGRQGHAGLVASVESVLWAEAITHFAKAAIGRKRPVLYTELAPEVADVQSNQRSMPSGHASTAFALATSYWLTRRNLTEDDKPWLRWVLMAGAAGVGIERVLAGKHHPSDVLVGAGVGVASALVIHEIKF
jgi:membrane-associated phospholipid phosphatase